jgi:uncharacterized protein YdhG (YjbR/CyaY superfamily)
MIKTRDKSVDKYISKYPKDIQGILHKLRHTIKEIAPQAEEKISYNMPAYKINGKILVYFAAFKGHMGFFPTPSAIVAFKKELRDYKTSKGTVQFPLNEPVPYDLIRRIVKFRVKENLENN